MNSIPAGIQQLHQQDIDATVSMDLGKLTNLWAEDGVLLGQGDEPLVGKAAIEASFGSWKFVRVMWNTGGK